MSSCYDANGFPQPCGGWSVYDSYVTDPRYQVYYSIAWASLLVAATIFTLPSIISFITSGRWKENSFYGLFGIYEDLTPGGYNRLIDSTSTTPSNPTYSNSRSTPKSILSITALIKSISLTTPRLPSFFARIPSFFTLNTRTPSCHPSKPRFPFSVGTFLLFSFIPLLFVATILPESQLRSNPNRFGFISLASIPPLFILSSKNGIISYLTGKGWTSVNFLHRWLGRFVVFTVLLHVYFWTIQWVQSNQISLFLSSEKEIRGLAALGFLLLIGFSSIRPMRKFSYPLFFVLHYLGIIGFLFFVNRHTIYAQGWATYSILAIYGLDLLGRLKGMRIRYVEVEALEGEMTRVGITGVRGGWRAGQHLSVRLFFTPPTQSIFSAFRSFEAHPFSISTAPASIGILNSTPSPNSTVEKGIQLYIKSCGKGSWTDDLFKFAQIGELVARHKESKALASLSNESDADVKFVKKQILHMYALVEGPYGGLGYQSMEQENLLLVAGGSGMSFIIGILDEIVGRRKKSGKGGKIEIIWAIRERSHITWFLESLHTIIESISAQSNLSIVLRIYITCDQTLTSTISPSSTFSPPSQSSIISLDALPPHTQIHYSRPQLTTILSEHIELALAPCGNCWPVCHCGDSTGGICGNDEEGCCGESNSKPVKFDELEDEKNWSSEEKKVDELVELPVLKSCCSGAKSTSSLVDIDQITELPTLASQSPPATASCCSPTPISGSNNLLQPAVCGGTCCASTGSGCCSGGIEGNDDDLVASGPLRVRTNGLGVVVCGPGEMIGELRNATASIPLSRQVKIGGIDFHAEHFSL